MILYYIILHVYTYIYIMSSWPLSSQDLSEFWTRPSVDEDVEAAERERERLARLAEALREARGSGQEWPKMVEQLLRRWASW